MFDEIELHNNKILTDRLQLKKIKTKSIKDFVYSHRSIPHVWKNKFSYKNDILHAMKHDKNFLNYLGMSSPKTTTVTTTLNKSSSLFNIFPKTYNDESSSTKHKQQLLSPSLNTTHNEPPHLNNTYTSSSSHIEHTSSYYHKLSTNYHDMYSIKDAIMHDNKMRMFSIRNDNNNHNNEMQIELFLEEYKSKNSLDKKFTAVSKKDNRYSRNIKVNDSGVKYKDKKNIFNGALYSQIVPNKQELDGVCGKENGGLRRYNSNKSYVWLNDNNNERNTIEISNKFIRNNLESINYYGPHSSYCKSCKNKNIRFYNELEHKQCLDFIHIIKKMKLNS